MSNPIGVVVADDHPLLRDGVVRTLLSQQGIEVLGEADSADGAVEQVIKAQPDIALLDISMPGSGIEAARRISEMGTSTRIVMLTVSEEDDDVAEALKAGAHAYVLKGVKAQELVDVIRDVDAGGTYIHPLLATQALFAAGKPMEKSPVNDPHIKSLTEREREILKLVSVGKSNREVGTELDLQEKTIKHHMTSILKKLQVKNRVEAALKAHAVWGDKAAE